MIKNLTTAFYESGKLYEIQFPFYFLFLKVYFIEGYLIYNVNFCGTAK